MRRTDGLQQEIDALRARLSRLSEASLRINESLDFETVLQGVLDSARALTDARYGVITLLDDVGEVQDYLSSGMTAEESERIWETPHGRQYLDDLSQIHGPLRISDFNTRTRAAGLPEFRPPVPVSSELAFLMAPIRHRGTSMGAIYLGEKDHEFSLEDEETLVMFASQAALVIANARTHREEQRTRADLETLLNTSPVGVAVFDALNGRLVSLNNEAKRIAAELRLPDPDGSLEQLPESATIRRADGHETTLADIPLRQMLSIGQTVRAEEVIVRGPDGRELTTLINATPILAESGAVESVLVTIQDMTPIEELERLRSEFLGMVSHELRTPLTSIRGSATTLLDEGTRLDPAEVRQFHRIIIEQADQMRGLIGDLLDVTRIETGTLSVALKPTAITGLVDEARSRFLSSGGRHAIEVDFAPDLPAVSADQRRITQVLSNLLANAARFSPDTSPITVAARRDGVHVAVSVADQGRGVPAARLPYLFRKFFRLDANEYGHDLDSSGIGLAICKGIVEAHGGRIWAASDGPDRGSRFTFTLPAIDVPISTDPGRAERRSGDRPGTGAPVRILAIDDDPLALRHIHDALSQTGYTPIVTTDPLEALPLLEEHEPALVLVDLVLPGTDGMQLMRQIRSSLDVPVIFLSAYGQDEMIARAFDMGAADYVVKPFSPTELAARIRAALRKNTIPDRTGSSDTYSRGELTINLDDRQVTLAGQPIQFTAIEFRLLAELAQNHGRVLTYEQLLRRVWDGTRDDDLRPMRTVVTSLRRKLGDHAHAPTYIFTEPRIGYRMARADARTEPAPAS